MIRNVAACPVCGDALLRNPQGLQCAAGHSFDRHKKGYYNLLLANQKRSKAPGDDANMVLSRKRFLQAGHYAPLAQAIAELVAPSTSESGVLLDAGCGEGYYTGFIGGQISGWDSIGVDISKPAIAAASQNKTVEWLVASSARLPILSNSIDVVLTIFSRIEAEEFHRVLNDAGKLLVCAPGERHLWQLRSLLYDDVRQYDVSKHLHGLEEKFKLLTQTQRRVPLHLNRAEQIQDLLNMTPHGQRLKGEKLAQIQALTELQDEADFCLYVLEKR